MVTARTPSPIDAVLPEYIAVHESTGESYESIADRVEGQGGSKQLVEALRKFDDDSEAFKVNQRINREAEQRAKEEAAGRRQAAHDPATAAQRDAELDELRARLAALESKDAGGPDADPTTSPTGSTTSPKGRQRPPADKA